MSLPFYNGGPTLGTLIAASDLSSKQYFVVKVDTAGKVALQTSANSAGGGILLNTPAAGEAAEIAPIGGGAVAPVTVGGTAVAAGDKVSNDTSGKIVPRSSTNAWIGTALNAGASGEVVNVLLNGSDGAGS